MPTTFCVLEFLPGCVVLKRGVSPSKSTTRLFFSRFPVGEFGWTFAFAKIWLPQGRKIRAIQRLYRLRDRLQGLIQAIPIQDSAICNSG